MSQQTSGRADVILVRRGLVASREKARTLIQQGAVKYSGQPIVKPSQTVPYDGVFELDTALTKWVSRGGLKLAAALDVFDIPMLKGAVCIDLGASTGGFTDVLLACGAEHIYAVDVGFGQLAEKLVRDRRVTNLEKTHARDLDAQIIPQPIDIIVCDLSFISLTKALRPAFALARSGAFVIALVKPQFEAGRAALGKGGIVRNETDRQAAIHTVRQFITGECGWIEQGLIASPIRGSDGNKEYLICAHKP